MLSEIGWNPLDSEDEQKKERTLESLLDSKDIKLV